MPSIATYLGFEISLRIHSYACAAIGTAPRRRLEEIRRLDVEDLWVRQKIRDRSVALVKVLWFESPADILTTYIAANLLTKMLKQNGLVYMDGRASAAPELPREQ